MRFLLGLTGSIGMGKSTTAKMFAEMGCQVWDADAAVHRAYDHGGSAVDPIYMLAPDAIIDGQVSRDVLKNHIRNDSAFLGKLEAVIHPLVQQDRTDFIAKNPEGILVFDIPLLFEKQSQGEFDAVACVLTTAQIQAARVMARPGMTQDHFDTILSKQMDADDKAALADYVIRTDTLESAGASVQDIIAKIKGQMKNA